MTENQKLREVLQAISHIDDTTNHSVDASAALDRIGQIARQALALPTADHLPDAGKMIETAVPVGERERFEAYFAWSRKSKGANRRPNFERFEEDGTYKDDHTQRHWWTWQQALSAGDAVLAEREACAKLCEEVADDLITAMRKEGETDDEVMTRLVASARVCAEEIRGGYSKKFNPHNAAIDAAILARGEGEPLTRYRVWPEGTVQDGAESPYTWMSDDFTYVNAVSGEQAHKLANEGLRATQHALDGEAEA